ncbi:class GN sortase [Microbulbifer yueqingensis]|uniref:Sortase A n=1 Tax=Microbulbifer yueqingensis TaxID=658219 RepID=A0A1G8VS95_9GAMM|nr:class GN sortase [Microbulbifer yueqingensis]SDJ68968.1 sortase A [Microbulbifer yueqingensis]
MVRRLGSGVLVLAAAWLLFDSAWLIAKARLAQYLIDAAWQRQVHNGEVVRPWPWADTWPVARLRLGGGRPLVVLAGSSGQALAFGPGLVENSGEPGSAERTTVIAAHRDTHFGPLRKVRAGARLGLQDRHGRWHHYQVRETRVVDSRRERLPILAGPGLMLVTCYPFDALVAGGPQRFVVFAEYLPEGGHNEA